MIEAIIFDLDGTLLNTLDDLQNSTNYALQQCDFPLITKKQTQEFVEEYNQLVETKKVSYVMIEIKKFDVADYFY